MRSVVWLVAGFALYRLSDVLESMGDAAPMAAQGVSGERLRYHGAALVVLLAAAGCFIRAGVLIWRNFRDGKQPPKPARTEEVEDTAEAEFDPDAALAHYLEKRGERPPAPPGSFGRKGL